MLKSVSDLVAEAADQVERVPMEQALKIDNVVMVDAREQKYSRQTQIQ